MANELVHGSVGTGMTQAEFEAVGLHVFNSQATGDVPYASSATQLSRLAIGTNGQFLYVNTDVPGWKTLADTDLPAHGIAQHTDVARDIFYLAELGWSSTATKGSAYLEGPAWLFPDATALSVLGYIFKVPDDFVSFTSLQTLMLYTGANNSAGAIYWRMRAYYRATGEAFDTHVDTPAIAAMTVSVNANIPKIFTPTNALTMASLAKGDYVSIDVDITTNHAANTLDRAIEVYGILFTYVAEQ